MSLNYIKTANLKKLAKSQGKRVSKDFAEALDRFVEKKMNQALLEHNGGKKTLDQALAGYILGNK